MNAELAIKAALAAAALITAFAKLIDAAKDK